VAECLKRVRVAAVQLRPAGISESLEKAVEFIGVAGDMDASIVCLPEAWFHHDPISDLPRMLQSYNVIMDGLSDAASANGVWVIGGGLYSPTGPQILSPIISPSGEVPGVQEKVHLFRDERKFFKRGERFKVFEINGVATGILVCHDIVYPEAARILALKGAELIFNPSRIISAGCQPWRTYLEARCLENRVPIVAANITLPNLYGGCSRIITVGETGMHIGVVETLAEEVDDEKVLTAEIDLEKPSEMRRERLSQRILEAYENIYR
jgi:omega-amidase